MSSNQIRCNSVGRLVIGVLMIAIVSLPACTHQKSDGFDLSITAPGDAQQLSLLEKELTVTPEKAALHPEYQVVEEIATPFVPEYRVGSGDIIEIVYHIRYDNAPDEYRLDVQDRVSVTFPFHPQFSTSATVRTDGKLTVPLIGDVQVLAKTPQEVASHLNRLYSKYLINPSITVSLEEFNVKIEELKRVITTAPRGQSKIAPVKPDGRISFPIIGELQAEGMTVKQLEETVNERYGKFIESINVTLVLLEIHHPKFYIAGEVNRPGAYEIQSKLSLMDALAIASGYTDRAELRKIVFLRNDGLERPIAFKVNLEAALAEGMAGLNLMIKPADIIYVPKSGTENLLDMIQKVFTRGVYAVMPFTTTFSWGRADLGGHADD